ncbi:MAG: hypothetical protein IPI61_14770 [Syntrophaceae bacterium]|nr:hypothetical protein [Syntrophaceae bacterium]
MAEQSRILMNALPAVALAVLTAALYAQVGAFDYVNYDDPFYVQENLIVQRGLTAYGVKWAFTTTTLGNWHPLTWLSYMLDCRLFGAGPGAHHLVNVLFHALNAVLLFLALERMTQARWRSAFAAALFALHPCTWSPSPGSPSARTCSAPSSGCSPCGPTRFTRSGRDRSATFPFLFSSWRA